MSDFKLKTHTEFHPWSHEDIVLKHAVAANVERDKQIDRMILDAISRCNMSAFWFFMTRTIVTNSSRAYYRIDTHKPHWTLRNIREAIKFHRAYNKEMRAGK
jgi:hypothetical protein